ncbi:uncharacterized protein LOC117913657 [Vitis riparia]|uniref:uncharacterized protein LOC117913657 n=1 Tax=Vitis riparia TaxID=96939 RepID=UPI00155A9CC8|nr:uncharacterized protein LOC117913657 [Vitis riparia]
MTEPFPFSFGALMNFQLQGKEMKISLGEMHFSSFVYSFASLESILKHAFGLKNIDLSKTRNIEEVGIRGLLIMEHWFTQGKCSAHFFMEQLGNSADAKLSMVDGVIYNVSSNPNGLSF